MKHRPRSATRRALSNYSDLESGASDGAPTCSSTNPRTTADKSERGRSLCSLAPNTFDVMVRNGRMPKPRILTRGRKAWDVRLLDKAIDELPLDGEDAGDTDRGWDD